MEIIVIFFGAVLLLVVIGIVVFKMIFSGDKNALMFSYFGKPLLPEYTVQVALENPLRMVLLSHDKTGRIFLIQDDPFDPKIYKDYASSLTLDKLEDLANRFMEKVLTPDGTVLKSHFGVEKARLFNQEYPVFKVTYTDKGHYVPAVISFFLVPGNRVLTVVVQDPSETSDRPEGPYKSYDALRKDLEHITSLMKYDPVSVGIYRHKN